jgi:hypothetical protein
MEVLVFLETDIVGNKKRAVENLGQILKGGTVALKLD